MAPTCCVLRRACSCLGSSSSVLRFRPFSTSSVKDLATIAETVVEKVIPYGCYRDKPFSPVPEGFPFSIKEYPRGVEFIRQDKDERTEIALDMNAYQPLNGNPCYDTDITIHRGFWYAQLYVLVAENMLKIHEARMVSEKPGTHLKCYEEILESKGVDARKIFDFFKKQRKEINMSTNA